MPGATTNSVLAPPWSLPKDPFFRHAAPELGRGHDCRARRQAASLQVDEKRFERGVDCRQIGGLLARLSLVGIEIEWYRNVDDAQTRLSTQQLGGEGQRPPAR